MIPLDEDMDEVDTENWVRFVFLRKRKDLSSIFSTGQSFSRIPVVWKTTLAHALQSINNCFLQYVDSGKFVDWKDWRKM